MAEKRIDFFLVNSVTAKKTKGGKDYGVLQVFEKGGRSWQLMCWNNVDDIKPGDLVKAQVEESDYQGTLQLNSEQLRKAKGDELEKYPVNDYLPSTPYSIDGLLEDLNGFITVIGEPSLRVLLGKVIGDPRWKRAAAAKQLHHAYIGGLLEHTVSMCKLAVAICPQYAHISRDLVLTGCMLHDIGKMDELTQGITTEYTIQGEMLGHITIGIIRVVQLMNEDPEAFGTLEKPTELRLRVLHMIGSHHGQVQYGAIKMPMTPEADLLCKIDGLDAGVAAIKFMIDKAPASATWTEKVKWETRIFIGEPKPPEPKEEF
jgi:3'-5' exoribonuclease